MTGSGKTGLCVGLLEEAAIDGVPVIAIDPKGDLGNLLLTFPTLAPDAFRPWVDDEEARRAGQTPETFAAGQAKAWTDGLAAWGQDANRIQRLRAAADFAIYTPGSRAGLPVSVLSSFNAPPPARRDDAEVLAERANATATSVLSLAGVEAAPRSREHSLLSALLTGAWQEGRDLDFASLIQQVQSPPFQKVGILDLESFFPQKDRFSLAVTLNGVLAAPGFAQWFEGEPLDPATLLRTVDGKPRVSIFSIAHLGDAERMFFVSLLLNQIVGWMRTQSGTSSLRAILYMDEIAGYFPPVANPPSKSPLLTMLKQARAFGVGVVLATQNPVDLDYKGLANTGTWFLGRLQTERDKARLLDGLEGAAAGSIDRAEADKILSTLGKRVFLLHNVHQPKPLVFQTRWTMSYLRGPLSKEQIKKLTADTAPTRPVAAPMQPPAAARSTSSSAALHGLPMEPRPAASVSAQASGRPILPPGIDEYFIPDPAAATADAPTYMPVVIGSARVSFSDAKLRIDMGRDVLYATAIKDAAVPVEWAEASRVELASSALRRQPESPESRFAALPSAAQQPKNYAAWQKAFSQWLSQNERIELLRHAPTKLTARVDEAERDFRTRVHEAMREARDKDVDAVRAKFATKRAALEEKIRRAEGAVQREEQQASQQKTQTMLSAGAAMIGAFFGKKTLSATNLGRATTAARGMGRSMKEAEDVKRASAQVETLRQQLVAFDEGVTEATHDVAAKYDAEIQIETVALAPKRGQVSVQFVALGWDPR